MSAIDGVAKTNQARTGMVENSQPPASLRTRQSARAAAGADPDSGVSIQRPAGESPVEPPKAKTGAYARNAQSGRASAPADASETATRSADSPARSDEGKDKKSDELDRAVNAANFDLEMEKRSMRFRINDVSEELQIQIVDTSRDKIIRSIPSDEMIKLSSRLRELFGVGAMVDESR